MFHKILNSFAPSLGQRNLEISDVRPMWHVFIARPPVP